MNKLYTQIAAVVALFALGGLWAFDVIDSVQFGTMYATALAALTALNQNFEKSKVVEQLNELEEVVIYKNNEIHTLNIKLHNKTLVQYNVDLTIKTLNNEIIKLKNDISKFTDNGEPVCEEIEEVKPKVKSKVKPKPKTE